MKPLKDLNMKKYPIKKEDVAALEHYLQTENGYKVELIPFEDDEGHIHNEIYMLLTNAPVEHIAKHAKIMNMLEIEPADPSEYAKFGSRVDDILKGMGCVNVIVDKGLYSYIVSPSRTNEAKELLSAHGNVEMW